MRDTLKRGNKLPLQEGKLTRKAGSYIQPSRNKQTNQTTQQTKKYDGPPIVGKDGNKYKAY